MNPAYTSAAQQVQDSGLSPKGDGAESPVGYIEAFRCRSTRERCNMPPCRGSRAVGFASTPPRARVAEDGVEGQRGRLAALRRSSFRQPVSAMRQLDSDSKPPERRTTGPVESNNRLGPCRRLTRKVSRRTAQRKFAHREGGSKIVAP